MHRNIESLKKSLSEDTDYMTSEMSALLAKVDSAIRKAKGTTGNEDLTTPAEA